MGIYAIDMTTHITMKDGIEAAFTSEGYLTTVNYRNDSGDPILILTLSNLSGTVVQVDTVFGGVGFGSAYVSGTTITNYRPIMSNQSGSCAMWIIVGTHYFCAIVVRPDGSYLYGIICKTHDLTDTIGVSCSTTDTSIISNAKMAYNMEMASLTFAGMYTLDDYWYSFYPAFYTNSGTREYVPPKRLHGVQFLTKPAPVITAPFLIYGDDVLIPAPWISGAWRFPSGAINANYSILLIGGNL